MRNSLVTIAAILCLGLIVSGAGLKLPAFSSSAGAIVRERPARVDMSNDEGEVVPSPRADRDVIIQTDKSDYALGEIIILTGAGWEPGEIVTLLLHEEPAIHPDRKVEVVADAFGAIFDNQFMQDAHDRGVTFYLTATGTSSGLTTQAMFGKPAVDLDQCANGSAGDTACTNPAGPANAWQNGNLNANQAQYLEGDSVAYRDRFSSLTCGATYTKTIEWDTTKAGKHALDYLTTWNFSEVGDPLSGVTLAGGTSGGCNTAAPPDTFDIPTDPNVTKGFNEVDDSPTGPTGGDDITQAAGVFTCYGCDITSLGTPGSEYTRTGSFAGDSSTSITITFTAKSTNPVLAWGGHISTRLDWGQLNSAVNISGSPYHMRDIGFTCSNVSNCGVGQQDRSLSNDAVVFPATITIIKDVAGGTNATDFGFTTTGLGDPSPSFSLDDDGDNTNDLSNTKVFDEILTFGTTRTVTETDPSPSFLLTGLDCDVVSQQSTPGTATEDLGTRTATFDLKEGEAATCTFTNTLQNGTLIVIKHVINDNGGTAVAGDFTMNVSGGSPNPSSFSGAESPGTSVTLTPNTAYSVTETGPTGYSSSFSADCTSTIGIGPGQTKTCTVTNDDVAPQLIVIKHVINDSGGTAVASDFTLDSGGANDSPDDFAGEEAPGTTVTLDAGSYNVTETGPSGYTASFSADCSGSIAVGETKTCTVTNDDNAATLIVIKHVINDNGGTAVAGDFTLDSGGTNDSPDDFAGDEAGTTVTLDAGSYNVTENGPSGYAASFSADCSGTIANGQTKTCTVTNDDNAATLIVIKHVINDNGGTAVAANFTLDSGGTNDSPDDFAGEEAPGTNVTLDAGSYSVTESGPSGYSASFSADCSGSIAVGQTKTCTVTNDDQAATLIVIKHVINDNGGTAVAGDFTLDSGGTNDSPDDFAGEEAPGTTVTLDAGSYNVTENSPGGYTASFSGDCSGTIANGVTKTCTVTNDDVGMTTEMSWTLHDKVSIPGIVPGGGSSTATFDLYGPFVDLASVVCTADPIPCSETVDVVEAAGEGTASTQDGCPVSDTGFYAWKVHYSGNSKNTARDTECGSEVTEIKETNTIPIPPPTP
jgi:hypothetical protein